MQGILGLWTLPIAVFQLCVPGVFTPKSSTHLALSFHLADTSIIGNSWSKGNPTRQCSALGVGKASVFG